MFRYRDSSRMDEFPLPRAQENVAEKAQPETLRPAGMGRSTDADGERECARTSPSHPLHRPLDKLCFIDGPGPSLTRPGAVIRQSLYFCNPIFFFPSKMRAPR